MDDNQTRRKKIRQAFRLLRNQLNCKQQKTAAQSLLKQTLPFILYQNFKRIGLYLANDGEIDPMPLIKTLWHNNIEVFLPRIHPFSTTHLIFLKYESNTQLDYNRFNIAQPKLDLTQVCPFSQLDLVLLPLVAFDQQGNRLGMGGGFYDRMLASENPPQAIGLAHNCQLIAQLPIQPWDMPLQAVITPDKFYQYKKRSD